MDRRMYPLDQEAFCEVVEPLIVSSFKYKGGRPAKISHYRVFCAVLYVLRTGVAWRDMPPGYGNWHTIYTRFKRWSESGLWWQVLYRLQENRSLRMHIVWVDSTTVKVHRHGSGAAGKRGFKASAETVPG